MTQEPTRPDAEQLRVGVVGIGWAGQQHLEAYSRIPGVRVVALAAMEAEPLARLQAEYDVPATYARWEDMLDAGGLDAISVAVPTFLHAPITVAALERGLHVLSEKPLAKDAIEGRAMVDAARRAGRVLDVAFNHRRRGDIGALKTVIDSGEIGRPYYAKAAWLRRKGIPTLGSWFTNPALAGGGPLVDIGVHVLDYSLHLLGEPTVVSVSATTHSELGPRGLGGNGSYKATSTEHRFEVEDFSSAFLRLEGGGALLIEAGWASYRNPDDEINFLVYGTDGGAELRVAGEPMPEAGHLTVYKDTGEASADYAPVIGPNGMHQQVVEDFVSAVRSGPEEWARHDGSVALGRARIIDAAYRSARENREVQL